MTVEECRIASKACNKLTMEGIAEGAIATAVWEVAAQFAELNENMQNFMKLHAKTGI